MIDSDELLPEIEDPARREVKRPDRIGRQRQLVVNVLNVSRRERAPLGYGKLRSSRKNGGTRTCDRADANVLRENSLTKTSGRNSRREGGQGESKRVSLGMQGRETTLERGVREVKQETLTDSEGPSR